MLTYPSERRPNLPRPEQTATFNAIKFEMGVVRLLLIVFIVRDVRIKGEK